MKRTLILVFSLLFGMNAAQAQQQFATLQHGDSISVFYGNNALTDAHTAAVDGDVIALSSGSFASPGNITKAITIRGAGMYYDTIAGSFATTIVNGVTFNVPSDTISGQFLTVEGIRFLHTTYYLHMDNPHFIKCFFERIDYTARSGCTECNMTGAYFVNCIIKLYRHGRGSSTSSNDLNSTFVNSVIYSTQLQSDVFNADLTFINCVAAIDASKALYITINNSVVFTNSSSNAAYECINTYNSIGINDYSGSARYFSGDIIERNLHNYSDFTSVFKYFNGSFVDGTSMELQDSIATTILGSDGTQVGIYGGQFPFNPRVINYKATVANQSRADGKLEVTVQPVNE